jgi:16S rRNA (uracil1498-N3)-methyltransferase
LTFTPGAIERARAAAQVVVGDLEALELSDTDSHHLFKVRRLRDGEVVIATDGRGSWRRSVVVSSRLAADGSIRHEAPAAAPLTVGFAPAKGDRSEWAVAKLTELGCDRIVALKTEHASVRWSAEATTKALARWRRVALEASCQSRRVTLPAIEGLLSPAALLSGQAAALGVPGGPPLEAGITTILIGPEGGWSEGELGLHAATVGLGDNVLRTETAAVAAGVLLGASRAGTVGLVDRGEERR